MLADARARRRCPKYHLGYYLLLGLEFLIAADIVHTVLTPTLADLAILGAIVAIRTVISFSINWELRQASRHEAGAGIAAPAASDRAPKTSHL